jgi:hypothetical protein
VRILASEWMTGYLEVMGFSVEHGYRYLGILAGNEELVCQFKLPHQGVHLLLQKQARPLCQDRARIRCFDAIGVSVERKADSPNY